MSEAPVHTPQRLRSMAARVYRMGQTFNVQDLREVGDYLAGCAAAADGQGDILQQRDAARAELARLQQATAEADVARIRLEEAQSQLEIRGRQNAGLQARVQRLEEINRKLAESLQGQRLWYHLALEMVSEARALLPPDKWRLIDPMKAADVARSDRQLLYPLIPLLRRALEWVTLYAQSANDGRAAACAADMAAFLESDACRKFSPPSRSSTS